MEIELYRLAGKRFQERTEKSQSTATKFIKWRGRQCYTPEGQMASYKDRNYIVFLLLRPWDIGDIFQKAKNPSDIGEGCLWVLEVLGARMGKQQCFLIRKLVALLGETEPGDDFTYPATMSEISKGRGGICSMGNFSFYNPMTDLLFIICNFCSQNVLSNRHIGNVGQAISIGKINSVL